MKHLIIGIATVGFMSWFVLLFSIEGHHVLKTVVGMGFGVSYGTTIAHYVFQIKRI